MVAHTFNEFAPNIYKYMGRVLKMNYFKSIYEQNNIVGWQQNLKVCGSWTEVIVSHPLRMSNLLVFLNLDILFPS